MTMAVISKTMRTETGHRLMAYDGKCRHLHGHSYKWRVSVKCNTNQLSSTGFVLDYKELKETMAFVLDPLDHALLLRDDDPLLTFINRKKSRVIAFSFNPTAENLAKYVYEQIEAQITSLAVNERSDIVSLVAVEVWETETSYCRYPY